MSKLSFSLFWDDPINDEKIPDVGINILSGPNSGRRGKTDGAGNDYDHFKGLVDHIGDDTHIDLIVPKPVAPVPPSPPPPSIPAPLDSWRGLTAFMLFRDYVQDKDITPFLQFANSLKANNLRVLGMAHYIPANVGQPDFRPFSYTMDQLHQFVSEVNEAGQWVEFVTFADAQLLMPEQSVQTAYIRSVESVLLGLKALSERANEPLKNGVDPLRLPAPPAGLSASHGCFDPGPGDGSFPWYTPPLTYTTYHPSRSNKYEHDSGGGISWGWEDAPSDVAYMVNGYRKYPGVHQKVIMNEPIGAAAVAVEGRRDNVPAKFKLFSQRAKTYGGATAHSDALIQAHIPEGLELECVQAFAEGWL